MDVASTLLKAKADLHAKDDDGQTPLSTAAENSQSDVVALLLEAKSHVDEPDARGRTPLFYGLDWVDTARLLLQAKSSVDAVNRARRTPLMFAAKRGYDASVPLLLEAKSSVDAVGGRGRTALPVSGRRRAGAPLCRALACGNRTIAALLRAATNSEKGACALHVHGAH